MAGGGWPSSWRSTEARASAHRRPEACRLRFLRGLGVQGLGFITIT